MSVFADFWFLIFDLTIFFFVCDWIMNVCIVALSLLIFETLINFFLWLCFGCRWNVSSGWGWLFESFLLCLNCLCSVPNCVIFIFDAISIPELRSGVSRCLCKGVSSGYWPVYLGRKLQPFLLVTVHHLIAWEVLIRLPSIILRCITVPVVLRIESVQVRYGCVPRICSSRDGLFVPSRIDCLPARSVPFLFSARRRFVPSFSCYFQHLLLVARCFRWCSPVEVGLLFSTMWSLSVLDLARVGILILAAGFCGGVVVVWFHRVGVWCYLFVCHWAYFFLYLLQRALFPRQHNKCSRYSLNQPVGSLYYNCTPGDVVNYK